MGEIPSKVPNTIELRLDFIGLRQPYAPMHSDLGLIYLHPQIFPLQQPLHFLHISLRRRTDAASSSGPREIGIIEEGKGGH